MKADYCHRFLPAVSLCALLSGCAHPVKISYPSEASIHPAFNQPFTTWAGERVRVVLTPSLRGDSLRYLANNDQVFLANSLRQRGLRHEYSMGGLLAHTLVSDSGDALWNVFVEAVSRAVLSAASPVD